MIKTRERKEIGLELKVKHRSKTKDYYVVLLLTRC